MTTGGVCNVKELVSEFQAVDADRRRLANETRAVNKRLKGIKRRLVRAMHLEKRPSLQLPDGRALHIDTILVVGEVDDSDNS